jgi:hypothetical protein
MRLFSGGTMPKSIKFEISLEKLSVKFEGDIHTAERLQGEIAGAINSLASAQHKMLAPVPNVVSPVIDAGRGQRGRRRRKGAEGIDPAILDATTLTNGDGEVDGENGSGASRPRRSSGGATTLLTTLKDEGFFSGNKRTIGEIREELGRKGHTFKSNEVSPGLVWLTKNGILKREKNADKQWIYFAE